MSATGYHPDSGAPLSHHGFMDWSLLVLRCSSVLVPHPAWFAIPRFIFGLQLIALETALAVSSELSGLSIHCPVTKRVRIDLYTSGI